MRAPVSGRTVGFGDDDALAAIVRVPKEEQEVEVGAAAAEAGPGPPTTVQETAEPDPDSAQPDENA